LVVIGRRGETWSQEGKNRRLEEWLVTDRLRIDRKSRWQTLSWIRVSLRDERKSRLVLRFFDLSMMAWYDRVSDAGETARFFALTPREQHGEAGNHSQQTQRS